MAKCGGQTELCTACICGGVNGGHQQPPLAIIYAGNIYIYIRARTHARIAVCMCMYIYIYTFFLWRCDPTRVMASSFFRFLDHKQRRTTVGRTPRDEWLARRRDLYLDNTQHSQQTNIHDPGWILTHDLSRRATGGLRLRPRGHWDRQLV
jgi:hypothetical protein